MGLQTNSQNGYHETCCHTLKHVQKLKGSSQHQSIPIRLVPPSFRPHPIRVSILIPLSLSLSLASCGHCYTPHKACRWLPVAPLYSGCHWIIPLFFVQRLSRITHPLRKYLLYCYYYPILSPRSSGLLIRLSLQFYAHNNPVR